MWCSGPDGECTLCGTCFGRYYKKELPLYYGASGTVSAQRGPESRAVLKYLFREIYSGDRYLDPVILGVAGGFRTIQQAQGMAEKGNESTKLPRTGSALLPIAELKSSADVQSQSSAYVEPKDARQQQVDHARKLNAIMGRTACENALSNGENVKTKAAGNNAKNEEDTVCNVSVEKREYESAPSSHVAQPGVSHSVPSQLLSKPSAAESPSKTLKGKEAPASNLSRSLSYSLQQEGRKKRRKRGTKESSGSSDGVSKALCSGNQAADTRKVTRTTDGASSQPSRSSKHEGSGVRSGNRTKSRKRISVKVSCKVPGGNKLPRRYTIDEGMSFDDFRDELKTIFHLSRSFLIAYRHEDGDDVAVTSNNELSEMFAVVRKIL